MGEKKFELSPTEEVERSGEGKWVPAQDGHFLSVGSRVIKNSADEDRGRNDSSNLRTAGGERVGGNCRRNTPTHPVERLRESAKVRDRSREGQYKFSSFSERSLRGPR